MNATYTFLGLSDDMQMRKVQLQNDSLSARTVCASTLLVVFPLRNICFQHVTDLDFSHTGIMQNQNTSPTKKFNGESAMLVADGRVTTLVTLTEYTHAVSHMTAHSSKF